MNTFTPLPPYTTSHLLADILAEPWFRIKVIIKRAPWELVEKLILEIRRGEHDSEEYIQDVADEIYKINNNYIMTADQLYEKLYDTPFGELENAILGAPLEVLQKLHYQCSNNMHSPGDNSELREEIESVIGEKLWAGYGDAQIR